MVVPWLFCDPVKNLVLLSIEPFGFAGLNLGTLFELALPQTQIQDFGDGYHSPTAFEDCVMILAHACNERCGDDRISFAPGRKGCGHVPFAMPTAPSSAAKAARRTRHR